MGMLVRFWRLKDERLLVVKTRKVAVMTEVRGCGFVGLAFSSLLLAFL